MANKEREAVRQGMGDILGPSTDLLSQVLEGDRKRTGRVAASERSVTHEDPDDKASRVDNTTGSTKARVTGSALGSISPDATEVPLRESTTRPRQTARRSESADSERTTTTRKASSFNPLETALREMLTNPYTTDLSKGPFTVTSMKLNTEVSERLGWASTLLKRPKQDIVSEALRLYFERILLEG